MLEGKKYTYSFNCNTKQLKDKINYYKSINKAIDVEYKDAKIIIKRSDLGRKTNSAFVGEIVKSDNGCRLEGLYPDEKSNRILVIFMAAWYFMFVFFTYGKLQSLAVTAAAYGLGLLFIVILIYIFMSTQKKAIGAVKKFIEDLSDNN